MEEHVCFSYVVLLPTTAWNALETSSVLDSVQRNRETELKPDRR